MGYLEEALRRRPTKAAEKPKGGLFGIKLPDLGIGQAVRELGAIPGGLLRLGTSLAPGGEPAGKVWSAFGKGAGSSLLGTAINVADVGTLGALDALGVTDQARDDVASIFGDEYRPQTLAAQYQERGLLGPLIENVGNVALGAGALGKLGSAGRVGRLGAAEASTSRAARAGFSAEDITVAAEAAKLGRSGLKEAGVRSHELRRAGKDIAKAEGLTAPPAQVAARARTLNRLYDTSHPYRSAFRGAIAPLARAGQARSITGAKAPSPPADLAPDRAAAVVRDAINVGAEGVGAPEVQGALSGADAGGLLDEGAVRTATPDVRSFVDDSARAYAAKYGLPEPQPVDTVAQADPVRGRIVAAMYRGAKSNPDDPAVQKTYSALAQETVQQYQHLKEQGVQVEFVDRPETGGVYADEASLFADIEQGVMRVDRTGPGEEHLVPAMNEVIDVAADGTPVTVNDAFRAVHDYFGHSRAGNLFDRNGEDVAWRLHAQMFSPEAQPALFTETVGQNSYLNFDPANVTEKALGRQAQFPDQKAAILPEHVRDPDFRPSELGPVEQGVLIAESLPTPEWAESIVARLPDPAVRALYKTNRFIAARRAAAVVRERIRLQDIDRRKVLRSGAVQAGVQAATEHVVGRTLPDGTRITPALADELLGDTVIARLDLTEALESRLVANATPEQAAALRQTLEDLTARSKQRIPQQWLFDTDGTPTALGQALDEVAERFRQANAERLETLRSTRKGDKGLENVEATMPSLSTGAQRLLARATRDVATAEKLERTRIPREIARAERRIQEVGDEISRTARRIQEAEEAGRQAVRDLDRSRRYVPEAFRTDDSWAAAVDEIVAETLDNGGASYNPHESRLLRPAGQGGTDTGFAVGATRGTARAIRLTGQVQTDAVALAEAVDHVARAYQDLLQNPDVIVGTWIDDNNTAHIDVSEIVAGRDEAILKAAARQQDSIYDLNKGLDDDGAFPEPPGRPDIAVEFLRNHRQRTRYATQLRQSFAAINARRVERGQDPLVTEADIDAQMALNDLMAVTASRTQPERFRTADSVYATMAAAERRRVGALKDNPRALFELVLGKDVSPELVDEALTVLPNAEKIMRWYQDTNDAIRRRYTKPDGTPYRITLGNGKVVEVPDLIFQLVAVTSIQQTPAVNLGDALNAVANYQRIVTSADDGAKFWTKLMDDFLATPARNAAGKGNADSPRTLTELFERTIKPAEGTSVHRYWTARFPVIEILNGNTLDTWGDIDPETGATYVEARQALAGSKPKSMDRTKALERIDPDVVARLGEDRAVMEYYGQGAYAKIRSFYDNLADPANSTAVTLDMWMARLLGADTKLDLMQPGTYLRYAEEVRDLTDVLGAKLGRKVPPHELQALLWAYAMSETNKLLGEAYAAGKAGDKFPKRLAALDTDSTIKKAYDKGRTGKKPQAMDWRNFADHLADPTPRIQRALDEVDGMAGDTFFQRAKGQILGAMVAGDNRNLMLFFDEANAKTLVHEHAHALRRILGDDDVRVLERAYRVDRSGWGRAQEERFARDFETYLATRQAPTPGLAGYFARIASLLSDAWRTIRGQRLNSDVADLLDRWLDPAETRVADADVLPEFSPLDGIRERIVDGVYTQAERSPRQRALRAPDVPGATTQSTYRRGVVGGEALAAMDTARRKAAELEARKKRLEKNLNNMKRTLIEGRLDSQVLAQRFRSRAERSLEKIAADLDDPSISRAPAAWQPLWGAVKKLHQEAETNPLLAELLEDVPESWTSVLRIAAEQGFDPTHVRSFQPSEVRQLVYGNVRLGKRGRDLGQTEEAGTRKQRRDPNARTRSLSALAAASVEATHELHTNALADFIENTYARPVEDGVIPDGYVGWDAERSFLLAGERGSDGTVTVKGRGAPTKAIPKEVKAVLDNYQRDFSHASFRALRTATDPWRLFVLTLSPRWDVNNFAGNLMMASKEGVGLQDWAAAWRSFRKGGTDHLQGNLRRKLGAGKDSFGDTLGAIEGSVWAEAGERTLIPFPAGKEGLQLARTSSRRDAMKLATTRIRRANEVVDEMARVAVYHSQVRKGASHNLALKRTYEALVDYNDLSPFERQVVRSIVPFYAWQKGILKLTARFPIDHPQVAGIMMTFAEVQQQLAEDRWGGELPQAYASIIPLPGLGNVNTRAVNPFQDAASLVSPQGIAQSLNPFFDLAVRNALGAPEGGFVEHQRMDEFGNAVPDTSPAQDFTEVVTSLPQLRLGESLTGANPSGMPTKPPGQAAGQFVGVPTYTEEQVQAIIERVMRSQQRLGAGR